MAHLRPKKDYQAYEIEKKIIETLIGPVIVHDESWCTIWRFENLGHVTIGEVKLIPGKSDGLHHPLGSSPSVGSGGSGWCYVPQTPHPIMWPPCSFADFLQRLSDPETRKKHGLPPL